MPVPNDPPIADTLQEPSNLSTVSTNSFREDDFSAVPTNSFREDAFGRYAFQGNMPGISKKVRIDTITYTMNMTVYALLNYNCDNSSLPLHPRHPPTSPPFPPTRSAATCHSSPFPPTRSAATTSTPKGF